MSLVPGRAVGAVRRTWHRERREIGQVASRILRVADGAGDVLVALGGGRARGLLDALDQHVVPYLDWEEAIVHPVIDRLSGTSRGSRLLGAQLEQVRGLIGRVEADWLAARRHPTRGEVAALRASMRELGLVLRAYLDQEERVLVPVLVRAGA